MVVIITTLLITFKLTDGFDFSQKYESVMGALNIPLLNRIVITALITPQTPSVNM
jgi:hypothetical protein